MMNSNRSTQYQPFLYKFSKKVKAQKPKKLNKTRCTLWKHNPVESITSLFQTGNYTTDIYIGQILKTECQASAAIPYMMKEPENLTQNELKIDAEELKNGIVTDVQYKKLNI